MLEAIIEGDAIVKPNCGNDSLTEVEKQDIEIQQKLLAKGLIREIKRLDKRKLTPFNPIKVGGEPVSKMIIRERR